MGRRPLPTAVKILRGNPGKGPLNKFEPAPRPTDATPPAHLAGRPFEGHALELWNELAPVCAAMGTLTAADRDEFALGCVHRARTWGFLARADDCRAMGDEKSAAGFDRLAVVYSEKSSAIFARYGVGASDRSRITVAPRNTSKWAELLGA